VPNRVLVIEHPDDELPGVIGERLVEVGLPLERFAIARGGQLPDPRDFAAVVVLGSIEAVYDERVPWVRPEADIVAAAVRGSVPVLGICFGGQLLASVLGGGVGPARQPERGWLMVDTDDPELVAPGPWMSWHRDAFAVPPGGTEVARSEVCAQAFAHGPHLGLQFHPEVTLDIVETWLSLSRSQVPASALEAIRSATHLHAASAATNARRLVDTFLRRAGIPVSAPT
jgi:GMP synthase-like glutamine amidotransferase